MSDAALDGILASPASRLPVERSANARTGSNGELVGHRVLADVPAAARPVLDNNRGMSAPWPPSGCAYFCVWCMERSAAPVSHKALGPVCPHCLRPSGPFARPRAPIVLPSRPCQTPHSHHGRRLRTIAKRDGWICQLCGQPVNRQLGSEHPHRASVDHIIRAADGGSNEPSNLRLAHQSCNQHREVQVEPFAVCASATPGRL